MENINKSETLSGQYQEITVPFCINGLPETSLDILLENIPENSIVLIQDIHDDCRIRAALSFPVARRLYGLGFDAYLIEAPASNQELLDEIGKSSVNLYNRVGIGRQPFKERSYADAIYAMKGAGMRVFAIDNWDERITVNQREEHLHLKFTEILKHSGQ